VAADEKIITQPIAREMRTSYLDYAMSVIVSRALPDVRDGLKPVQRRILYGASEMGLAPDRPYKKCARVVGDVIGKFHPHGDVAVYDALVRLAQDFAQRYPLVDGQGNFGNIDGDNPAAMRYTESRLTQVAEALLADIDENTVDFRPTYDGENDEPLVLPARFPNLLANGASGIAVGMATSIPPHNIVELCDALIHLVKHKRAGIGDLVELMPGPDFPTGGVLVEDAASIKQAYATGRGSFRLRARWNVEKLGQGTYQVVVAEIPYQVQKSRLIERIAQLLEERKLPLLADVRDESSDIVRLVLEPKSRNVEPAVLMESLFRATELETRIGLNLNVLDKDGVPRVMNLKEALQAFLDHRREVLQRRSRFRREAIAHRSQVLKGLMIVYLHIDEVIRLIRNYDDAKERMMKRWHLTSLQADAILDMRLRALRKVEEIAIRTELKELAAEDKELAGLLADEKRQWKRIGEELTDLRKEFGPETLLGKRRTTLAAAPTVVDVPLEALVEREPVTVVVSVKGWVRAAKGHGLKLDTISYKEGDGPRFALEALTTDKLLVFATNGRFYTLAIDKLPGGRGNGEPVRMMVDLPNEYDVASVLVYRSGEKLLLAASDGRGFIAPADEVLAQTRNGKQVMRPGKGAVARVAVPVAGDHVAVIGENRKLLIFPVGDVPELNAGRGVIMQRYHDGGLSDAKTFKRAEGLSWKSGDRVRTETDLRAWLGARAAAGRIARGFNADNKFG